MQQATDPPLDLDLPLNQAYISSIGNINLPNDLNPAVEAVLHMWQAHTLPAAMRLRWAETRDAVLAVVRETVAREVLMSPSVIARIKDEGDVKDHLQGVGAGVAGGVWGHADEVCVSAWLGSWDWGSQKWEAKYSDPMYRSAYVWRMDPQSSLQEARRDLWQE